MPRICVLPWSHTDHRVPPEVREWILDHLGDAQGFVCGTWELPDHLPAVPCDLYGPLMGDPPVTDAEVYMAPRDPRPWPTRFIRDRAPRMVREVSVIAGPAEGHDENALGLALYTMYGGPLAPREPGDTSLENAGEREVAAAFWADHALVPPPPGAVSCVACFGSFPPEEWAARNVCPACGDVL